MKEKWQKAWKLGSFRIRTIAGLLILVGILFSFPFFFQAIEKRNGTAINDWILNQLPALNMSYPIFIIIWACTILMFIRAFQQPMEIFILFLWSYVLLSILRLVVISLVPLNPPIALQELKDPISNNFYGMKIVTKDLFFSGHISTLFLMFLCLQNKKDKIGVLAATFIVTILLLIQHVHYTVDVLSAPLFAFGVYWLTKKFILSGMTFSRAGNK